MKRHRGSTRVRRQALLAALIVAASCGMEAPTHLGDVDRVELRATEQPWDFLWVRTHEDGTREEVKPFPSSTLSGPERAAALRRAGFTPVLVPIESATDAPAIRQLLDALEEALWDDLELRLDPRLVPSGPLLDTIFVDSGPGEMATRTELGRSLGLEPGDIQGMWECAPYLGYRIGPVPDSVITRMNACSSMYPYQVVNISVPAPDGEGTRRRVFMSGKAGFHAWVGTFDRDGRLVSFELEQSSHA